MVCALFCFGGLVPCCLLKRLKDGGCETMTLKEPKPHPWTKGSWGSQEHLDGLVSIESVRSAYLYYVKAMSGTIQEGIMDKECGWFALQLLAEAFQAVSEDVRKMKGRGKEKVKERANKRKMHCINCDWHGSGKPNQKCPKCRDMLIKGDVT